MVLPLDWGVMEEKKNKGEEKRKARKGHQRVRRFFFK